MNGPDRIPCCVPFCKRTAQRLKFEGHDEIICGKHFRLASPILRRRLTKMRRRAARERNPARVEQLQKIDWLLWARIKKQAIELAVGL